MKIFSKNYFVFSILFFVGFLIYLNVIFGHFLFDDNLLIENNVLIQSLNNFWQFFTANSQTGAGLSGSNFYRPMQYIVYALIYKFFGFNVVLFHLASILLHIANAFLLFLVFKKLTFSRVASFIAAVFFLIHPVNVEAVSYISGIADPLGFFFVFLGILQFLEKRNWLTFLCFVLALFSKESTIIFAPLILLISIFKKEYSLKMLAGIFLIAVVYLILKFSILDFTGNIGLTGEKNIYTENIFVRLTTFVNILWEYAKLLVLPLDLYLERPYRAFVTLFSLQGLFGLMIIFMGFFLRKNKNFLFGYFWFFISILPLSGIIPLNAMYLEHWLYFPLVGILIFLAAIFDGMKRKEFFIFVLIMFATFFALRVINRNTEWADPVKFYLNELKYTPDSARVQNNLAMEYSDQKEYDLAIQYFNNAILLRDIYPQTHHNLANVYLAQGKVKEAETEFLKALAIDPNFRYSYSALMKLRNK